MVPQSCRRLFESVTKHPIDQTTLAGHSPYTRESAQDHLPRPLDLGVIVKSGV